MIKKLHVLVLEGWPTLLAGGQERSLFEVVRGLRTQGVDFTLAFEQEGDLLSKYAALGIESFQIPTRQVILKSRHTPQSLWKFFVSVCLILKQHRAKQEKWNLIYVNQYFDLPLAVLCGRILGIPVFCHLRLAAPHYLSRQYRWGLNRCALLICNSRFTAMTYQKAGIQEEKMVVIHNAVSVEEFSPASEEDTLILAERETKLILYLGRIAKKKGIEILIDAVALARKSDNRLRLLVVGNPRGDHLATVEYHQDLTSYGKNILGDAVEFRPATTKVVELYRLADLVVLPAEWDESFGRVVIESMACGVPCLASRVGGIPEILNGEFAELLVERSDPADLSRKIMKTIAWRSQDPMLGSRCRRMVEATFDYQDMCERMYLALQSVITGMKTSEDEGQ